MQFLPIAADDLVFGFEIVAHPSGIAVLDLGGGLVAAKVRTDDGRVEYVTCDHDLRPLYEPATSMIELKQRFANATGRRPAAKR